MLSRNIFVLLVALSFSLWPTLSNANELVSGQYQGLGSKKIRVELTIGSPAPASIILVQKMPKGVKVTDSQPELKKYSPAKGKAKWLLSKIRPGKLVVSVSFDRPVASDEINGEIRYRDPAGKMVTFTLDK